MLRLTSIAGTLENPHLFQSGTFGGKPLSNTVEKFPLADLSGLRDELMQSGLDSRQAAELITAFLAGRGYGVSSDDARQVAVRIDMPGCSFDVMQKELESLAYVM